MAEAVVDLLEPVEVQEEHGDVLGAGPLLQRLGDALAEQRPVGQLGERVVVRLVHQLFLQFLALADVAGVEHQAGHAGVA